MGVNMRFFLLAAMLTVPAEAGTVLVDIGIRSKICEGSVGAGSIEYQVWKHLGTTETTEAITETEFEDLVSAADWYDTPSCADFGSTASSILGSWYNNLPTDGKTSMCWHFQHVKDAG